MAERLVKCIKLGQELPGLTAPPMPGGLGEKIYENVSRQAWDDFVEYFKMVINEYRLDLTNSLADQVFEQKAEEYFFGKNLSMPEGYVPPKTN